jgi:large exoprotein involved in heme utilization and adhesion
VEIGAGSIELRDTGVISTSTGGAGDAGEVTIDAGTLEIHDAGEISSSTFGGGNAGLVEIGARHLTVRDGGLITSSSTGIGAAGDVQLSLDTLLVEDASIRTEGIGALGGRIEVTAGDLIHLHDAEMISVGAEPAVGTSVITLQSPAIVLNDSRVLSLTATGEPVLGSSTPRLLSDLTVISSSSQLAAELVVPEGAFLNVGDLLRESCAARRAGTASSFTAMGHGGRLSDPAGPLAGAYREPGGTTVAGQAEPPVLAASFGEGCKAGSGG